MAGLVKNVVRLAKTPLGFFAVAMGNQLVEIRELPEDPRKAAEELAGNAFEKWASSLRERGYDIEEGWVDPLRIAGLLGMKRDDYIRRAREVAIELARLKLKEAIGKDYLVIQVISALDDLNKSINIMMNRIREWYGLHYPELKEEEHEKYLKLIIKGERKESMGLELSEKDLGALKEIARMGLEMYKERERLESYLKELMNEVAPNVSELAGENLGARLIERAGGLKQLAFMPGSTIQVLGAERALFKHLQKGSPPPKHGVIFQHPMVNKAPAAKRGKLARALAAKLAMAARVDLYSGKLKPEFVEDWKKRAKEIMEAKA